MLHVHAFPHSPRTIPLRVVACLIAAVAALDSCAGAEDTGPSSSTRRATPSGVAHEGTTLSAAVSIRVCNQGAMATYATAAPLGVLASPVTLGDGHCALVWRADASDNVSVTVTRAEDPAIQSDAIVRLVGDASTVEYARSSISSFGSASADLVFFNSPVGADPWTLTKALIKTCDDYNAWIAKVREALEAYKAKLLAGPNPSNPQIAGQLAAIQRFLDNAAECTGDSDLENKKAQADLLLRPIDINKALAALWLSGFQLYAVAIDLMVKSLSDPVGIPFDVINKMLDFMIEGATAVGNTNGAKHLEAAKAIKDKVKEGLDTVQHLKEALDNARSLVIRK
jgi:hypothetical protein